MTTNKLKKYKSKLEKICWCNGENIDLSDNEIVIVLCNILDKCETDGFDLTPYKLFEIPYSNEDWFGVYFFNEKTGKMIGFESSSILNKEAAPFEAKYDQRFVSKCQDAVWNDLNR